jgi:hypothetical protein
MSKGIAQACKRYVYAAVLLAFAISGNATSTVQANFNQASEGQSLAYALDTPMSGFAGRALQPHYSQGSQSYQAPQRSKNTTLDAGLVYQATLGETLNNAVNQMVIDSALRVIGGTMAEHRMPGMKLPFIMSPQSVAGTQPRLKIGMIAGINTPEAHDLGASTADHISSPAVVKLNGKKIKYIYHNDRGMEVMLPKQFLNQSGFNVLQIDAGYYFERANTLAYDKVQFQDVAVVF